MSGVNKAIILGHLGKDPDIRTLPSGGKAATFSVATSESWRDKTTGERKEKTDWHRVVIFNEALVKVAESYLKKGSKVYVEGAMRPRDWTDQGNVKRYVTEIVLSGFHCSITLLDRAPGAPPPDENSYGTAKTTESNPSSTPGKNADIDDEIPF